MKKNFLILFFIALLSACNSQPAAHEHKETLLVFGTLVEITLYDVNEQQAEKLIEEIRSDLEYLHFAWHPWKSGSMGRTNQLLEMSGWFSVNPSVLPVIIRSKELSEKSQGLFNPAIGSLIELWNFHSDDILDGPIPSDEDIQKLLRQKPSVQDIQIQGVRIKSTNPAVRLDAGGIAKGMAVDKVIDYLKQAGVKNAIVNAGGDLKAIGQHGDRKWHIGIRHPRQDGVIAGLDVNDNESVFTSGDYERFFEYEGKRYHHIIDPRSGYPAQDSQSVTVIHSDAGLADAAATALFIAGPSQWQSIAKSLGVDKVMLIDKNGKVYLTKAMAERLEFKIKPVDKEIVTLP